MWSNSVPLDVTNYQDHPKSKTCLRCTIFADSIDVLAFHPLNWGLELQLESVFSFVSCFVQDYAKKESGEWGDKWITAFSAVFFPEKHEGFGGPGYSHSSLHADLFK